MNQSNPNAMNFLMFGYYDKDFMVCYCVLCVKILKAFARNSGNLSCDCKIVCITKLREKERDERERTRTFQFIVAANIWPVGRHHS